MQNRLFLDAFREVVARHPERVAIEYCGEPVFTYAQLDLQARTVAKLLVRKGVEPEQFVGIKVIKSPGYIVSMLAIWYAGAAYVPLDPALPAARLRQIEEDCQPAFVIEAAHLCLRETPLVEPVIVDSGTLAYAIFTSGSTGRPKGVLVTHSGIVNLLEEQIKAFRVTHNSRSLFMLSTNFDASISDIGCALLSGATLCMELPSSLEPGPEFPRLVADRRITHIDIPPSVLRMLSCPDMPDCLETLIIGGEVCPTAVVREWARRFRVVNVYGPTEATVCTSLVQCCPDTWNRPLIGQPLSNVEYKIQEEELLIGGPCLARGYLNRPELDDRKFIWIDGQRWYRTGDRVVLHDDGEYEFQGRIDRQVKVRGVLVEPEEIEARLADHPAVQRAVVLKRDMRRGDALASPVQDRSRDGLVAFLQVPRGEPLRIKELRAFVAEKLPRWMIPHRWQFLDRFPLTLTGKPDFDVLRSCQLVLPERADATESRRLARTEGENLSAAAIAIISIIESVLAIEGVQFEDNIFELGADSLGVIEISLAADVRGLSLPPALLMAKPQISILVAAVEARESGRVDATANGGMSSVDLRLDVQLNDEFKSLMETASQSPQTLVSSPENVLLTGATGFLGSRLLQQLLTTTGASITCLVRCGSSLDGLRRIQHAMKSQALSFEAAWAERLNVIPADLGVSCFGLSAHDFDALAKRIDTVYHCAAQVNVVLPYSELRAANVGGTFEMMRFLLTGRSKWMHYASTLSVFVATDQNTGTVFESDDLQHTGVVYGGYAQTKWASEVLLRNVNASSRATLKHRPYASGSASDIVANDGRGDALASPFGISIYRFGLIVGDSQTGHAPKNDFLAMFAKGISSLGAIPEGLDDLAVDITPIDFASAAMLQLSLRDMKEQAPHTYHIANPEALKLPELIAALNHESVEDRSTLEACAPGRAVNRRICTVPLSTFREFVKHASESGQLGPEESAACLALCRTDRASFESHRTMDLFQATNIKFDMQNTQSRLSGLSCPPADSRLMAVLARHFLAQASV